MRLIAHRGNHRGRDAGRENTLPHIEAALARGYDVEVDLWLHEDGCLYLGHDGPAHLVERDYLLARAPRLWVHCKNLGALLAVADEPSVNCFSHDRDAYALTSRGFVWAYPGQPLASRCVCVMPEWNSETPASVSRQNAYGVCSDDLRPFLHLSEQYDAEETYSSMWVRNMASTSAPRPDPMLNSPADPRRCIALVARGRWVLAPGLGRLRSTLKDLFPGQHHYENHTLHHTFMQLASFDRLRTHPDYDTEAAMRCIRPILLDHLGRGYTLEFDRVCPVDSGLVMLAARPASSTAAVDAARRCIRRELQGGIFEPYAADICHATLLRYSDAADGSVQGRWAELELAAGTAVPLATLHVDAIDLVSGSWRMRADEVQVLATVDLGSAGVRQLCSGMHIA